MTEILIQEGDRPAEHPHRLDNGPEKPIQLTELLGPADPDIEDMNTLPAGQSLKLPAHLARADRSATAPVPAGSETENLPIATVEVNVAPNVDKPTIAAATKAPLSAEGLLQIIRPVISRMRGTITATGNYFIPLRDSTQVSIDCSQIPVVELDDGSTVFLDFGNRLPNPPQT